MESRVYSISFWQGGEQGPVVVDTAVAGWEGSLAKVRPAKTVPHLLLAHRDHGLKEKGGVRRLVV